MVHISRVELSGFKSFGGTTQVPFLPGFTVISGPNGSGKSNILDALLFCLGLATSKGMRAERLPDLVNHKQNNHRGTVETSVSVTFDVDSVEWIVTRKLRVTKKGSYASTFYINGESCNATELHQQLNRLRIYPEGYNIVLQGDVTRIITMNPRERREIIDELAGVAEFDRKISQTKDTLEEVREKEEKCQIITQELLKTRDRLDGDRKKAAKYQALKAEIQAKQEWEIVLRWRSLQQQQQKLQGEITTTEIEAKELTLAIETLSQQIQGKSTELEELNRQVKYLGEDEQLAATSKLATAKTKRHQSQKLQQDLVKQIEENHQAIENIVAAISQYEQTLNQLREDKSRLETEIIPAVRNQRDKAKQSVGEKKEKAKAIAQSAQLYLEEQTALNQKITHIQKILNPQRTEQAQLNERNSQLQRKIEEENQQLISLEQELIKEQTSLRDFSNLAQKLQQKIQSLGEKLSLNENELNVAQETQVRLLEEQRQKQRQLDKLEATKQAQLEAQGTYGTNLILQAKLEGVCGLVAQLGQVKPQYQLALETAAGGRLGNIVVENEGVGATGIELLKQKRAGRATFLPLTKIRPPRYSETMALRYAAGFVDLAVNLIECEPRYRPIFAYVFGNTVVFQNLNYARSHLGKQRIVTLEGEILEISGAMTGGSKSFNSSLHFGTVSNTESAEIVNLKRRLAEIEQILSSNQIFIAQKTEFVNQLKGEFTEERQQTREQQVRQEQLEKEIARLLGQKEQLTQKIADNNQDIEKVAQRLEQLAGEIPGKEGELEQEQKRLAALEESQTHSEWQEIQQLIEAEESLWQSKEQALREAEENFQNLLRESCRIEEKIVESQQRNIELDKRIEEINQQQETIREDLEEIEVSIKETEGVLAELSQKLGATKEQRDRTQENLRALENKHQRKIWQQEKLEQNQQEKRATLVKITEEIAQQEKELPVPLPEIPTLVAANEIGEDKQITFANFREQLEQLQKDIRNGNKRLEAMEPVNMLALEEYERTQLRLEELESKLTTLKGERTELLLRIENFTTLRLRAFQEAFDAVNLNFQEIFASLSEGDGYLQLDDPDNPFNGGLNLIAHPKGKPVQRLSSMSGGEKSLTALSFIFALQKYRPSPFYAFDEVDMFLDGANVERLSKMIKQQAEQAQFIVVSLRRPMIAASERTIGVTQARGAYTQVVGVKW